MTTTQAVILARGLGTRMQRDDGSALTPAQRDAATHGQKAMMDVGRPFIDYVVSSLADAGIADVVLVVAPGESPVRDHFRAHPPSRVRIAFAEQAEPRGTADAVLAARGAVRDGPFLVVNADNLYPVGALRAVAAIGGDGLAAFEADALVRESGFDAARVLQFALVDVAPDETLRAIREKPGPDDPLLARPQRWVSMNLWSFTPAIFADCARVAPSPRGELELQDAVAIAMRDRGARFRVVRATGAVLDLSRRADVAGVARRLAGTEPRP